MHRQSRSLANLNLGIVDVRQ
jgi:hypothetical protein